MAGFDVAMREAKELKAHMELYGLKVSIELQQGRGEWYVPKYLVMNHHTATRKGGSLTPALSVVKNGRSDVVGPLANGYGGYDFIFRIITMGLANHPGLGGPITIDGVHVPKDSMRSPSFGIEWEGGYHTWTAAERQWMAKANRAITEFYGRSIYSQLEHKDWAPTRKIDRNLPMTRAVSISDTSKIAPGGDDMTPEDHKAIAAVVRDENKRLGQYLALGQRNQSFSEDVWLSGTTNPKLLAAVNGVVVDVDEAAIAAAVVAAIAGTVHVEVDPALVTEAVKTALRQGTAA